MTTRRIIHAFDAGPALALRPLGLEGRFHGWRGKSGQRYLSTVFVGDSARFVMEGVFLIIRGDDQEGLTPLRVGLMTGAEAVHLSGLLGGTEVHVIFPQEALREQVCADLSSLAPASVALSADQPVSQSS